MKCTTTKPCDVVSLSDATMYGDVFFYCISKFTPTRTFEISLTVLYDIQSSNLNTFKFFCEFFLMSEFCLNDISSCSLYHENVNCESSTEKLKSFNTQPIVANRVAKIKFKKRKFSVRAKSSDTSYRLKKLAKPKNYILLENFKEKLKNIDMIRTEIFVENLMQCKIKPVIMLQTIRTEKKRKKKARFLNRLKRANCLVSQCLMNAMMVAEPRGYKSDSHNRTSKTLKTQDVIENHVESFETFTYSTTEKTPNQTVKERIDDTNCKIISSQERLEMNSSSRKIIGANLNTVMDENYQLNFKGQFANEEVMMSHEDFLTSTLTVENLSDCKSFDSQSDRTISNLLAKRSFNEDNSKEFFTQHQSKSDLNDRSKTESLSSSILSEKYLSSSLNEDFYDFSPKNVLSGHSEENKSSDQFSENIHQKARNDSNPNIPLKSDNNNCENSTEVISEIHDQIKHADLSSNDEIESTKKSFPMLNETSLDESKEKFETIHEKFHSPLENTHPSNTLKEDNLVETTDILSKSHLTAYNEESQEKCDSEKEVNEIITHGSSNTEEDKHNLSDYILKQYSTDIIDKNSLTEGTKIVEGAKSAKSLTINFLPVIALREFTKDDINYKKSIEELIHVEKFGFDKVYVVRKLNREEDLKNFCRDSVSKRSKLFMKGKDGSLAVKKLPLSALKEFCGPKHQTNLKEREIFQNDMKDEKFTVQKLENITETQIKTQFLAIDLTVVKDSEDKAEFNVKKISKKQTE